MEFTLLSEDDRPIYEDARARLGAGDFSQSWEWGDLKSLTLWHPIRLADREGGEVRLVATLLLRRLPLPLLRWSLLYCPRGPICDPGDHSALSAFVAEVAAIGRRRGAIMRKLEPDLEESAAASEVLRAQGLRPARRRGEFEGFSPRHVAILQLSDRLDDTFARMRPKGRYNVRLADRHGVTVREGTAEDLPAFYELLARTAKRQRFVIREFQYVRAVYRAVAERGGGRLLLAHREGPLWARALIARAPRRCSYVIGASADEQRQHMAAHLVQWHAIAWAHSVGARVYDFLCIGNPERPGCLQGLWAFKRQFGATAFSHAGEWDLPLLLPAYLLWAVFELPLSLARGLLGKQLRRLRAGRRPVLAENPG